jgi:transcriptional antiterminator NusG
MEVFYHHEGSVAREKREKRKEKVEMSVPTPRKSILSFLPSPFSFTFFSPLFSFLFSCYTASRMKYYAIQVKTGNEEKYIRLAERSLSVLENCSMKLIFPKRQLKIRRKGKETKEFLPLFTGYVFLETEELTRELYWFIRSLTGFYRFLHSNDDVVPMEGKNLAILKHFMSFGSVAKISQVVFGENDKIAVIEGPLKGLEGSIIKVDKRKGRAKVRLDFYDTPYVLDFAFENLSKKEDNPQVSSGSQASNGETSV